MFRSTHRALMAAKDQRIADLERSFAEARHCENTLRSRYDAFVLAITDTQRVTAERSVPPERPKVTRTELDPNVLTAIDFVAQGDTSKRRYLERYAKAEARTGKTPEVVSGVILNGDGSVDADEGV